MASSTSIANGALVKLGQDLINAITDTESKAARLCKERIDNARQVVLNSHPFNGSVTRVRLAALTSTPAYDYTHEFQIPTDCLGILTVEPNVSTTDYSLEGDKILYSGTTLDIIYMKDQTDYNKLDILVNEAISCYLAYDLAYIITNDNGTVERSLAMYDKIFRKAVARNNRQLKRLSFYADSWISARLAGGYPSTYPTPS